MTSVTSLCTSYSSDSIWDFGKLSFSLTFDLFQTMGEKNPQNWENKESTNDDFGKLEFMFMKHYAPNRCEPSIDALNWGGGGKGGCELRSEVFVKFQKKNFWVGGQGRCEWRSEVFVKIQKKKIIIFFFFLGGGGGQVDVNAYTFRDIAIATSKISKKGNNSKIIKKNFFQNFTKYFSHHPLSADISLKCLSLILFEIWHLQNFISIFSKGRNFTRGDNSKKNKYVSAIFP